MQPSIQIITVVPQFDAASKRYRCWCGGCCRITSCVKVIGVLELISILVEFVTTIVQYTQSAAGRRTDLIISIFTFSVGVAVIAMLFYAVAKERAVFLIPHLIMQIIFLIILAVVVILFGLAASAAAAGAASNYKNTDEHYDALTVITCVVVLIICLIAFFLEILFFVNVLRCYRFLKEKAVFERMSQAVPSPIYPAGIPQQQPPPPSAPPPPPPPPLDGYPNQGYTEDFDYKAAPV